MTDYVVYHKREKIGYPAIDVDKLAVYTNKTVHVSKYSKDRIWLIAGEGKPRSYYLRATYRMREIGLSDNPNYKFLVTGTDGNLFDPMPDLTGEPWFPMFRKKQGNFGFGFNPINNAIVVARLKAIVRANTLR